MKLRTRLFLWVGIIFVCSSVVSLVFEDYLTDKSLLRAEENLRQDILAANEQRREHIEEYLKISLDEDRAQIDSLLLMLVRDQELGARIYLEGDDLFLQAPAHSALLYKNHRWVSFIQSTRGGKLTSCIIPINYPMAQVHQVPIKEGISWVFLDDDEEIRHPYIGVEVTKTIYDKSVSYITSQLIDGYWGLMALFEPVPMLSMTKEGIDARAVAHLEDREVYAPFIATYLEAAQYVQSMTKKSGGGVDWIAKEIREKGGVDLFEKEPFDNKIRCIKGDVLNNETIHLMQAGDQSILIASLANLFATGEFGQLPFDSTEPRGLARFTEDKETGHVIMADQVFWRESLFDAEGYLKRHPSTPGCEGLANAIGVIAPKGTNRVFVVNALKLKNPNPDGENGYLTVGIDADRLVQDLVFSLHETAFLVHRDTVYSAFNEEGAKIDNPNTKIPFKPEMLKSRSGIVEWEGEKYYYLQMTPFPDLDIHFYLLTLESKAFALVREVEAGSREVIKNVSFNMQLIALVALVIVLFLLHNVAKRITKPITKLAAVTEDVAKGRLEDIELPEVPPGRRDEISTLCTSFEQMVKGLKEKEKVKGVLNKVVSTEIAEEILKGQVHLGGEEKLVTVFFADIRGFTSMTADMDPANVVELLNACMTKISHVIDEHGGVIDKYVGDEVMALFGAPLEKERAALNAVQSGLKILEVMGQWNAERTKGGLPPVQLGIGIHTGIVLAGNMGAENRLNYTVLGRNVNFASRLCSNAAPGQILISKEVLERPYVSESVDVDELPPIEMKGFGEPFTVFSVRGAKSAG